MNWVTLLTASIVLKSGGAIFRRRLLGRTNSADPYVSAIFFNLCAGAVLLLVALVVGFKPFDISQIWVWVLINIGAAAIADVLQFNAIKHIDAGSFAIIESTRVIWTIVGATILLHEGLTVAQLLAAGVILLAAMLVLWPQRSVSKSTTLGFILAASFAAVYGAATIVDRVLFSAVDVISYLSIALIVQGLILAIIYRRRLGKTKELFNQNNFIPFAGDVLFFVPSIVLLLEAIKRTDNLSLLSALLPLTIILSVLFSMIFLKERDYLKYKIAGSILAMVGVAWLALI